MLFKAAPVKGPLASPERTISKKGDKASRGSTPPPVFSSPACGACQPRARSRRVERERTKGWVEAFELLHFLLRRSKAKRPATSASTMRRSSTTRCVFFLASMVCGVEGVGRGWSGWVRLWVGVGG